jgi:hypothetical protein
MGNHAPPMSLSAIGPSLMLTSYPQPEADLKLLLERLNVALPPQPPRINHPCANRVSHIRVVQTFGCTLDQSIDWPSATLSIREVMTWTPPAPTASVVPLNTVDRFIHMEGQSR